MVLPANKSKDSAVARIVGSGISGIAELAVFHPVDTVSKRLMSNEAKVGAIISILG